MTSKPYILICDDESHILHVISLKLRNAGYGVLIATNGSEGLGLAQQHLPAMVITDYHMPGMNGLELCRTLRREPATAETDLVMITGRGANLVDEQLASIGFSAVFNKPFSPRAVLAHVSAQVPLRSNTPIGEHG